MKYTVEIDINLPRDKVIDLFDNTENLYKWLEGLQSFELLSGEQGQPGTRSKMRFKTGGRDVELVETVTLRELPERFDGTYETKGVYNVVQNTFTETGGNKTRWVAENEFRFSGFMKCIAWMMKGAFARQSLKHMQDFKAFAEDGVDVRDKKA